MVFTTRPDTLYGATFLVLAPEHPLVQKLTPTDRKDAVNAYIDETARKMEIDRMAVDREKSGVFTDAYAYFKYFLFFNHPLLSQSHTAVDRRMAQAENISNSFMLFFQSCR